VTAVRRVAVVVPARNEEARLHRCLQALHQAAAQVPPDVRVDITVVLDSCSDRSAEIVAEWTTVTALAIDAGSVGAARAAGALWSLEDETHPAQSWLACTDADSAVPREWLVHQLHHADRGVDLLLGLVRPDPSELSQRMRESWSRQHLAEIAASVATVGHHRNVHGANLGVRASSYLQVGGFPSVGEHEDRLLVDAITAQGGPVAYCTEHPVLTSGRTSGRTPGGFAGFLRALDGRRDTLQPTGS